MPLFLATLVMPLSLLYGEGGSCLGYRLAGLRMTRPHPEQVVRNNEPFCSHKRGRFPHTLRQLLERTQKQDFVHLGISTCACRQRSKPNRTTLKRCDPVTLTTFNPSKRTF